LQKSWHKYYAIEGQLEAVNFNFQQLLITTWRTRK
jgi:hypothetical protein